MAKAKTASLPDMADDETTEKEIGLSGAIKEGFKVVAEASEPGNRDSAKTLKAWILLTYPHLAEKVNSATYSSSLSTLRNKHAGGDSAPHPVANTEPTFPEVLRARELCHELKSTPDKLLTLLDELAAFGDIDKLKKCLNYAKELPALK